MSSNSRCIVTGQNSESLVMDNRLVGERLGPPRSGNRVSVIWSSGFVPAPISATAVNEGFAKRGVTMVVLELAPESQAILHLSGAAAREHFRATIGDVSTYRPGAPHPLMHRTETVDSGVVLSGEVYLILDHDEILLRPGDVFLQNGTSHAWSNRSAEPCRLAVTMVAGTFDPQLSKGFQPREY
jgi:mannose-6-phosphate isomerase-like protein (cupin superfamily)